MSVSSPAPPAHADLPRPTRAATVVIGLAWANLIGQIAIILTGGVVRLTGSGLGCSTWPQCEPGEFTPQFHEAASYHPFVEFGNRTITGVLGVIGIALALAVWRHPSTRNRVVGLRVLALAPLLLVLVQAVIGGITVLIDLHPAIVSVHFLVSAALVWLSALLLVRLQEGDGDAHPTLAPSRLAGLLPAAPWVLGILTTVLVVLGVITTGSGPHSGDSEVGYRLALDPAVMARVHALSVWVFVVAVLVGLVAVTRARPASHTPTALAAAGRARATWWVLLAVTALQGLIGYVQYFTGLPVPLVAIHMLGAGLLVAAVTAAVLALRVRD